MFGRMAMVQMKAAEDAFQEGRLDDAFKWVASDDLSDDRRAQRLRDGLRESYLTRGQERMLSRRFAEASADFDKAMRCGRPSKKVQDWQQRAQEAMAADQRDQAGHAAALAEARERCNAGSLAGAAEALDKAPLGGEKHGAMYDAIQRQTRKAEAALKAAEAALKNGNIRRAVDRFKTARRLHNKQEGLAQTEAKIVDHVMKTAVESFRDGRPDRAAQDLALLGEVGRDCRERVELEEAVRLARDAARALMDDRYARASVLLGRLAKVSPKAGWISDVRKHLKVLEEHRRSLLEGPLGLLHGKDVPSALQDRTLRPRTGDDPLFSAETVPATQRPRPKAPAALAGPPPVAMPRAADAVAHAPGLPKRLLLRIDGAGSFLLLRGDRISIGRSGPGASADVQLLSDLSERQAEIVRAGEDYFIVSQTGVELAGQAVDHALLQDGDRIRLSKRVRLKFRRPSLKSSAASLDLGEGVRMATDCRRVILWSGPVLMGGTRECHIKLGAPHRDFVLMERGGRVYVKPMGPGGPSTPIVLGEQMAVGALRFSVVNWSEA